MKLNKKELGLLLHSIAIHKQEIAKIKEAMDNQSDAGKKYSELFDLGEKIKIELEK